MNKRRLQIAKYSNGEWIPTSQPITCFEIGKYTDEDRKAWSVWEDGYGEQYVLTEINGTTYFGEFF
jgi:hypothetical protein